jgi:hypothetical protein
MEFWEELRHVMAPEDEHGRKIVVCSPAFARGAYEALAKLKGFDLDRVWSQLDVPDAAAVVRFTPDAELHSIVTLYRKYPTYVLYRLTIGHSSSDTDVIRRALYDIGILKVGTHVDRVSSHWQKMADRGWRFTQLGENGRWFGEYDLEQRP